MQRPRQEARDVGDGDLPTLTNQVEPDRDQGNGEPPAPTGQDGSINSSSHQSRNGSSIPYPFDSQSSLENEDGSHGTYRSKIESISNN